MWPVNLFELLALILAISLSFIFWRVLFSYIGWWAAPSGLIAGFGIVGLLLHGLRSFFARRHQLTHGDKPAKRSTS